MSNEKIGSALTIVGIVLVLLNFTIWNNSEYGLASALAAGVVIIAGLYFTSWKKEDDQS